MERSRQMKVRLLIAGALIVIIALLTLPKWLGGQTLIDSYSEANRDAVVSLNRTRSAVGQVFTPAVSAYLKSCRFYLSKENTPTGNIVARLYAVTGTPGSTAVPSGQPLATSEPVDVGTLSPWPNLKFAEFSFPAPRFLMSETVPYAIVVEYTGGTATNTVPVGKDNSGTHPGNKVNFDSGAWIADAPLDTIFYLYGDLPDPL